ncbi:MAG: polysaccharide biosynthesis protein [Leptospiraceae bacterium]|nr:polysaccharide biosynthesis protein [Leptospiraceae bacterium]
MVVSFCLAHLIRYESLEFYLGRETEFYMSLLIVISTRSVIFIFSNIYRSIWAHASIHDLIEIIKTTLISSLVSTTAIVFYNRFEQQSRMVPVLDTLILLSFLCFRSFFWRIIRDQYLGQKVKSGKPTLFLGAGKLGALLLAEIRRQPSLNLKPIGFLDDDKEKLGAHIHGLPILGNISQAEEIISKFLIQEVIITMNSPKREILTEIRHLCERHNIVLRILPSINEMFLAGNPAVSQLREVRVEDLLGREVVDLEITSIESYLKEKTILISGAGGSIGSEIARQVSHFQPTTIVLLDAAETPLYEIEYELSKAYPDIKYFPVIADVKNISRLGHIFERYAPSVVFHCAAYKHVPMMECNPGEAVLNNILGTKNIADVSRLSGVNRFVLISTDKAVNPVNIMGASKRAAELYLQHIAQNSRTKFITVRFGNVLGSNGSVIPRFKEQIQSGGPVTVTHPEIIRFFMTIPEASQLVLQAGSMGECGEIYILDMGEPVKILDLAEDMIRLSGFTPYKDIDIQFTGLRPGEKLYEELLLNFEELKKTYHPKIRIASPMENYNQLLFQNKLNQLFGAAKANKEKEIYDLFKEIIPEYKKHDEYISISRASK